MFPEKFRNGTPSPAQRRHYDLTVRRLPGGLVSNHLIDTLRPGDRLQSTGPMGTFFHSPLFHGEDVVFIAGGSGVVPAMSMIRDIAEQGLDRRFHLIYGSRHADDIICEPELEALAMAHSNLRVDFVLDDRQADWTGPVGLLSADLIRSLAGPLRGRMVYVCGPQALYPYALEQLEALGHPRRRIRLEANGAPTLPQTRPSWPTGLARTTLVTVKVRGGPGFSSTCGTPLLDALEQHGVYPPVACRSGECSLCRVRVLSGRIFSPKEAHLRKADQQFGYVHSCVAYPLEDVEIQLC